MRSGQGGPEREKEEGRGRGRDLAVSLGSLRGGRARHQCLRSTVPERSTKSLSLNPHIQAKALSNRSKTPPNKNRAAVNLLC
eukprot:3400411-Rhodomonas_salina.6